MRPPSAWRGSILGRRRRADPLYWTDTDGKGAEALKRAPRWLRDPAAGDFVGRLLAWAFVGGAIAVFALLISESP